MVHRRGWQALLIAGLAFGQLGSHLRAQSTAVAVIVHPSNSVQGTTSVELCDILLGERQRWPGGGRVLVIAPPARSVEWTAVLRSVCRMSEERFARQLNSRRTFGRATRLPQVGATPAEMKQLVAAAPNAIGFILASEQDRSVKTIQVDGRSPADGGYAVVVDSAEPR